MKICLKCGNEHDGKFGSGKFCDRRCANSRVRTEEIKNKISLGVKTSEKFKKNNKPTALKPRIVIECGYCKKDMLVINKPHKKKFCSNECFISYSRTDEYRLIKSRQTKQTYENGKDVFGGHTKWLKYKNIKVQGSYELRMCYILDFMKERKEIYNWEYTKDRYPYIKEDGNKSNYLLDFKIYKTAKDFYYIETKGYIRANDEIKWKTVRDLGYRLDVLFEDDIKELEKLWCY